MTSVLPDALVRGFALDVEARTIDRRTWRVSPGLRWESTRDPSGGRLADRLIRLSLWYQHDVILQYQEVAPGAWAVSVTPPNMMGPIRRATIRTAITIWLPAGWCFDGEELRDLSDGRRAGLLTNEWRLPL